jgi:hypothetical protein
MRRLLFTACVLLALPTFVHAELVRLEVRQRTPFADGKTFGEIGPYEMLRGIAHFAVDPKQPSNQLIVDLELAPRNKEGKVEFASEFCILVPKDPAKGNGALFYDVNNRGNKLALRMFNFAAGGNDLTKKGSEGDGFLLKRGFTVVWCGWIGEMLPGDDRLLLQAPPILLEGKPVRGLVRFEMSADKPVKKMPLSRRENHATYRPVNESLDKAVLTVRDSVDGERRPMPRAEWSIKSFQAVLDKAPPLGKDQYQTSLYLEGGFIPGKLYELICECDGAFVQGTGFAAVRDLVSFLRHDASDMNPCRAKDGKPAVNRALAFGVSQSGRFLRHLLYQGFNEDEKGRIVFDGLMPHVAGGGLGFFNHRFAQPTRHNGQHEDHTYPADVFPFTYGPDTDPFTKKSDSILGRYEKAKKQPRIMHTQSAAEYWHRAGSLAHTSADGTKDTDIPANVRIYAFGGTQHGSGDGGLPTAAAAHAVAQNTPNPADYRPFLRGLLVALDNWVKDGTAPPVSVYPRFKDNTLVEWDQKSTFFPKIPGVRYPAVIQAPAFCDYGPDFARKGIITREPPKVLGHYRVFVPRADEDGNDRGTLLVPDVAVPLATYTGWNLRRKEAGAEDQLASLLGSFLPFPKTRMDKEKTGDPRASIAERYRDYTDYIGRYLAVCNALVDQRYLLPEDVIALGIRGQKRKDLFAK